MYYRLPVPRFISSGAPSLNRAKNKRPISRLAFSFPSNHHPVQRGRFSALFGQHDIHFQHFEAVLLFQRDADVVRVDVHVLGDHLDEFALQVGQEVDVAAVVAFVGDDELQALLGYLRCFRLIAEQFLEPGHFTCLRTGA